MKFQEKYTSLSEKDVPLNKDKKIIGDDAFALGDIIQDLINKIESARLSLIR